MHEDLIKRLKVTEEMLRTAQFNEAASLIEETAVAIEELKKKLDEWQETACNWNNEYYHLLDNTPRWISVEERLPEKSGSYLVYVYGEVTEMDCWHGKWHMLRDDYTKAVTHWMPLPEPPKEGE